MVKSYEGLPHLNGSILCAIDFETTGIKAGYHEPIQFAAVPLDGDLRPMKDIRPFNRFIRPLYPERAEKKAMRAHGIPMNDLLERGLHPAKAADLFMEWFEEFQLPQTMVIVPLAHNYPFEDSFLKAWLGYELADNMFHAHARDAKFYAASINDRAFFMGEKIPFQKLNLSYLCSYFHIENTKAHDALSDCYAESELYRALLKMDMFNG